MEPEVIASSEPVAARGAALLHSRIDAVFGALGSSAVGLPVSEGVGSGWKLTQPTLAFKPGKDVASYSSDEEADDPKLVGQEWQAQRRGSGNTSEPVPLLGGRTSGRRKRRRSASGEDSEDDSGGSDDSDEAAGTAASAFGDDNDPNCSISNAQRRAFEEEAEEDAFDAFAVATMRPEFAAADRQNRQVASVTEVLPDNAFDRLCAVRQGLRDAAASANDLMDVEGGSTVNGAPEAPHREPIAAAARHDPLAPVVSSGPSAASAVDVLDTTLIRTQYHGATGGNSVLHRAASPQQRTGRSGILPDHVRNPQKYTVYTFDEPVEVGAGVRGGNGFSAAAELHQAAESAREAAAAAAAVTSADGSSMAASRVNEPERAATYFGSGIEFRPRPGLSARIAAAGRSLTGGSGIAANKPALRAAGLSFVAAEQGQDQVEEADANMHEAKSHVSGAAGAGGSTADEGPAARQVAGAGGSQIKPAGKGRQQYRGRGGAGIRSDEDE